MGPEDLDALRGELELDRDVVLALLERADTESAADLAADDAVAALMPGVPDRIRVSSLPEIDRARAERVLASVTHLDLAHDREVVPAPRAREIAVELVAVLRPGARWWTNGDLGLAERPAPPGTARGWSPLTPATFDCGVIGVDDRAVLIAWFMDED